MLYSITICYIALNIARAFARWAVVHRAARRRSSYLCPMGRQAEKVPEKAEKVLSREEARIQVRVEQPYLQIESACPWSLCRSHPQ